MDSIPSCFVEVLATALELALGLDEDHTRDLLFRLGQVEEDEAVPVGSRHHHSVAGEQLGAVGVFDRRPEKNSAAGTLNQGWE